MPKKNFSEEFKSFPGGRELILLDETESTNDEVKRRAAQGGEFAVIARRQTAGRGRQGRSFSSEAGGLYISVPHYPPCGPAETMHYTALAGLAVLNTVERVFSVRPALKWPNDVILHGKKICGILLEAVHRGETFFLVSGIGLNLGNKLPEDIPMASSLLALTGQEVDPLDFATLLIAELDEIYSRAHSGKRALLERYRKDCATLGKEVTVRCGSEIVSGLAVGITEDAALIVRRDGEDIVLLSGEATTSGI